MGRLQTDLIHYSSCAELGRTKESSYNQKDGVSMPRASARNGEYTFCPQLKACTYHRPFLGDICAIEHQLQRQGTRPNTNRPDRFTRGAFELTADALGFIHRGQSVPRVGLTARQATTATVSLCPT